MSTAGSTRSGEQSQYTPPAPGSVGADASPRKPKKTRIFRWQGIIPITLLLAILYFGWTLFGERAIRATITEAGAK